MKAQLTRCPAHPATGQDDSAAASTLGADGTAVGDAELSTLAVMQALKGFVSKARWLRYDRKSSAAYSP